jgi:phosphoribosylformylglycinamidine synthase
VGQIDHRHLHKADGEVGMLVVKIGGPAYRIGMGGGAASSVPSGSNKVRGGRWRQPPAFCGRL